MNKSIVYCKYCSKIVLARGNKFCNKQCYDLWQKGKPNKKVSDIQTRLWSDPERVRKYSDATKELLLNPEYKKNQKDGVKKLWLDPVYVKKQSVSRKKLWLDPGYIKKVSDARKKPEIMKKQSDACSNNWLDPNYAKKVSDSQKKLWLDPEYAEKHSVVFRTPEYIKKQSDCQKKLWSDSEYAEKRMAAMGNSPNKKEQFLAKHLNNLFPNEYKFVGDGQVILGGRCPDFINTNGQKKLIELYGDYWHSKKFTGVSGEQHEKDRVDYFVKFGFSTLVVWERELKELTKLNQKLLQFHNE